MNVSVDTCWQIILQQWEFQNNRYIPMNKIKFIIFIYYIIKRKTRTPGIPLEDILNLQGLLTKTDVSAYASAVVLQSCRRERRDTMARINRANQETADNLTNRRITRSMVRQGLAQL